METNTKPPRKLSFNLPDSKAKQSSSSAASAAHTISPVDEQFISQIVLTPTPIEQPLANVLSSVFAAGRAEQFMSTLQVWSARKEQEIEVVCGEGYGLFVPAAEAILGRVRENSTVLEGSVETLRSELASSAQQIYDTRVERFEARKMLLNVGRAIRALDDSLQALNLLQRINLDIIDGAYQEAVKLIDELQAKGLLRAIEEMPFCKEIESALEMSKKRVWDAAGGKVKTWLGKVRDGSVLMGSLALSQLQTRYEQFQRSSHERGSETKINNLRSFQLFLAETAAEDVALITCNDLFKVDFTPLQDVWRLFSLMDRQSELSDLLIESRRVQLELILGTRVILERADTDPKSLRSFLNALIGYFIFDRLLARLPLGIYSYGQVELRWEEAQVRLREIAMESLKLSASDRASFMKIKWQLVFFTHCADMFSFPATPLIETILALFYRYIDLLRQDCIERCQLAILKDSFTSPCPQTGELARLLPHIDPAAIPFSASVWECILTVQSFLSSFKVFLEGVPGVETKRADFADLSRRTVDDHLLTAVARALKERIHDSALTDPSQKMQILRNLECLMQLCEAGGDLVPLVTGITEERPDLNLNARIAFKHAFVAAQEILVSDTIAVVDPVLDRLSYDRNPSAKVNTPSPVIQDLIHLLKSIQGPYPIKNDSDLLWCKLLAHICNYFDTRVLADVKYPHCNRLFFQNLAVDLGALKTFCSALSENPKVYLEQIAQPLELCSLMEAESVHEFLDPVVRSRKYSHIETEKLISVLGRVKEPASTRKSVEDLIMLLK